MMVILHTLIENSFLTVTKQVCIQKKYLLREYISLDAAIVFMNEISQPKLLHLLIFGRTKNIDLVESCKISIHIWISLNV